MVTSIIGCSNGSEPSSQSTPINTPPITATNNPGWATNSDQDRDLHADLNRERHGGVKSRAQLEAEKSLAEREKAQAASEIPGSTNTTPAAAKAPRP